VIELRVVKQENKNYIISTYILSESIGLCRNSVF